MRLIPCIVCNKSIESEDVRVIAKICDDCNTGNLTAILKNLDYKKIEAIINKQSLIITKDGELI